MLHPKAIIGQKVAVLVNLEPREIKGITSQGMILMAENADGKLAFVSAPEGMHNGSVIRWCAGVLETYEVLKTS